MEQMRGTYPNAVALYESLVGLADPESGLIPKNNEKKERGRFAAFPFAYTGARRTLKKPSLKRRFLKNLPKNFSPKKFPSRIYS
jgi:hypothetical protein